MGDDVTRRAATIRGIPREIGIGIEEKNGVRTDSEVEVRGEVYMSRWVGLGLGLGLGLRLGLGLGSSYPVACPASPPVPPPCL